MFFKNVKNKKKYKESVVKWTTMLRLMEKSEKRSRRGSQGSVSCSVSPQTTKKRSL